MDVQEYVKEINRLCHESYTAYEEMSERIQETELKEKTKILNRLHSFLYSATKVYRYFHPGRDASETRISRARQLLENYGYTTMNSLYQLKTIRNVVDHYDEHLDRYVREQEANRNEIVPFPRVFDEMGEREIVVSERVHVHLNIAEQTLQSYKERKIKVYLPDVIQELQANYNKHNGGEYVFVNLKWI